ncbi:MAG TPA: GlmU family protein [Bacteroidales bacterium]|nr:GlmU family protein [Bacteroidales bacterium]
MNIVLFDDAHRNDLLPLTFMRPVAEMRIGITTIREKWEYFLDEKTSTLTQGYLSKKFPLNKADDNLLINGSVIPTAEMVDRILAIKPGEALNYEDYIIAIRMTAADLKNVSDKNSEDAKKTDNQQNTSFTYHKYDQPLIKISHPWQIFTLNKDILIADFKRLTKGKKSAHVSESNTLIGGENLFVEKGAKIEGAIINASAGPVYIGKDAEVMEGSIIRGPFALCNHSKTKMGAKIYGPTTIGPHCKVGGEVHESVFFGYANKAHDGFVGNSVIGEWCNLGADTNTSNLKNTYEPVRLYNYNKQSFIKTGEQFIGLIMGDHSKSGINTMFNTGTVVGVNANVFGDGFQRNFVPSFAWGGKSGYVQYNFDKAVQVAKAVYKRRGLDFDEMEQDILKSVFDQSAKMPR